MERDMTINEFLAVIADKRPPAPRDMLAGLEAELGRRLPADYRRFVLACNGGYVGGDYWFTGPTPQGKKADAGIHHIDRAIRPDLNIDQAFVQCRRKLNHLTCRHIHHANPIAFTVALRDSVTRLRGANSLRTSEPLRIHVIPQTRGVTLRSLPKSACSIPC